MVRQWRPEDVRADLLYLRKGVGFTDERLARRPALVRLLGHSTEHPETAEVLRERLESAISSLLDGDANLLADVFGFSPEAAGLETLRERRDVAARRLGLGREAVADRDAAAIERLLEQLLTGWYPKSPTGIRVPEVHNGFIQHAVALTTYVRDRRHLETRHRYRLFALFDGVEYVAMTMSYPTPPTVVGDDFRVTSRQVPGGWEHRFWHHRPMQRGHTYDLAFRVLNPDPNEEAWLTEESLAFHEPTRLASFTVHFLGDTPAHIWAFHGQTALQRPGTPHDPRSHILPLTSDNTATAKFQDAYGGLFSGVAWEW